MDAATDRLTNDLSAREILHGTEQGFWRIDSRDGSTVYARFFAPDNRAYLMQLDCSGYGEEPIGGRFVDEGRRCVPAAWPRGNVTFAGWVKFDPPHLFICWPEDRLALAHHPDWRGVQAWKNHPNQIYAYLDFVRRLLCVPSNGYFRAA